MPLTPSEEKALATLEDELRADDPALAVALTIDSSPPGHPSQRKRGRVRDEVAAEWYAFSPAIRLYFHLLPVGLVLSIIGGVFQLPWVMVLAVLVCLRAAGCTWYEARARRKAS